MENDFTEVNHHIESLEEDAKEWVSVFVQHMRENYPELPEFLSFQMPTYKLGNGTIRKYIAFGFGKNHFSLHCVDFEYIVALKTRLKHGGKGKGCVNVKFSDVDEKDILFEAIGDIYNRSKV